MTPTKARLWGKENRAREIDRQVDQLLLHHETHLASVAAGTAPPLPRATDAVAYAKTWLGRPYRITGCRCQEGCCCQDCSGLFCVVANHLHSGPSICTTSFAVSIMLRELNRIIPFAQALETPGSVLVRGPHNGEGPANGPSGSNGHIVIKNTKPGLTVEAMGRAYGIVEGSVFGRGFDDLSIGRCGLWPYWDYSTAPAAAAKELDMIILPGAGNPPGRDRMARPSPDGQYVEMWDGAKCIGTDGHRAGDPEFMRRWYPKNATTPPTPAPTPENPITGVALVAWDASLIVAGLKDGSTYRGKIDAT